MASNHFFDSLTFLIRPILPKKNVSIRLFKLNLGSAFGTSSPTYIKKICGSTAGDKITARGNVQLRFVTDNTVEKTGWSADYSIGGCGGYFEGTSGKIDANAHNLEGLIPQTVNCTFLLADTSKPNIEPEVDRVDVHFCFFKLHYNTS